MIYFFIKSNEILILCRIALLLLLFQTKGLFVSELQKCKETHRRLFFYANKIPMNANMLYLQISLSPYLDVNSVSSNRFYFFSPPTLGCLWHWCHIIVRVFILSLFSSIDRLNRKSLPWPRYFSVNFLSHRFDQRWLGKRRLQLQLNTFC